MTRARALHMCALVGTLAAASAAFAGTTFVKTALGTVEVGDPSVPTITQAVRDLPDWKPDPNLFGLEMKRREDYGFVPILYPIKPQVDPLLQKESLAGPPAPDAFSTLIHNFAGQTSSASPPDTVGDVGPNHFVQAVNQSVSTVQVLDKATGANLKTFTMQSLTTASPCRTGFCDPVVLYDRSADRWLISELPSSGGNVCVYVSTSPDPTGTWYAYTFAVETSTTDYPKYGVWPQGTNAGSYLIGVNAGTTGRDIIALDRSKMLAGQPATFQKMSVPNLPNSGFQLLLPSTMQGPTPPPNGEAPVFVRPRDDEAQDGASTSYDLLEMWQLNVDWVTPANTTATQLPSIHIGDYDMTLCGIGNTWNCMPQPGTTQKIDPIREPLHFPLQYRNFGDHETLVGTFPEDVDGTDHAALRWFELRKVGAGAWSLFQEGLVGGESGVHRSVGSIAMDGSGNIAIGYTRTGTAAPYYPSIYYRGRLSTDPAGTMPQGEYAIQDATTSKTNNERWGDYSGIGIDPSDDCTFWYTSEYGGSGQTRVAAFKFDGCGCIAAPPAPAASASVPQDNRIDVSFNDSSTASVVQYLIYRSTTSGGPYTQIGSVSDSSPGVANGPGYTYHDDTVSGGIRYFYVVKSTDGVNCVSGASNEVTAVATGACLLPPTFLGVASVTNPGNSTCTLNVTWTAGIPACSGPLVYNVYRSTTSGFAPSAANRIATGLSSLNFSDGVGIVGGTTYYYVVRAVDSSNGVEETNTVQKSGAPSGPLAPVSWTDTFEGSQSGGGFDQPGWSKQPINGATSWVWSTTRKNDGTHSWFAADVATVSDKVLTSPSFGVGASTTLSFFHTFQFEGSVANCYDAGTLEYTTNAGATWTVLPAADFTSGGFNGTANGGFSNPIGGKRAWCAGTLGTLTVVNLNLGADANLVGKTVQLRWHEGDDSSTSSGGWYVDTVTLTNGQTGSACTPGSGTLTVTNSGPICEGATLQLTASYTQAGVTYSWTGPNGFTSSQQNPSIPAAPAAANGTYFVTVLSGATPVASGSTNATVTANGGSCSDGNACTTGDVCGSGVCQPGAPANCDDANVCTDDSCNPATGCTHANNAASCSDGNACTSGDVCGGGVCLPGAPVSCNDGNPCTDDSCSPATGCVFANNTAACSDGNACTTGDACSGGSCQPGAPTVCGEGNPCTDDACNPATGCVYTNNTGPCDDGNACTTGDICGGGTCHGGAPVTCNDRNPCTDDSCNPATGCAFLNNDAPCDDGNACTIGDTCGGGSCHGAAPVVCNDGNPCTDDSCDALTGCVYIANTAACDDGNACTTGDVCSGGSCQPGTPVPPPGATSGLAFTTTNDLTWSASLAATSYDVVRGTLSALRSGGDFTSSLDACSVNDDTSTSITDPHVPAEGDGDWFLIRAVSACGNGTYDDGSPSQVSPRDAAIAASANTCP